MRKKDQIEISVLKRFGLRYSVLAAWDDSLRDHGIAVPANLSKLLERSRVKISSGCFPACDVGNDLGRIEAVLFAAATTAGEESAEAWLESLAECMSETKSIEELEKGIVFPAVKMHNKRFNFDGACGMEKAEEAI